MSLPDQAPLSRHRLLFASSATVPGLLWPGRLSALAPRRAAPTRSAAEAAHKEICRRFVTRDHGTLLHYAGLQGEVILPTPEDCEAARPNGMSWSTPIEDGPFFGGLYLAALSKRWKVLNTPEAAESTRRIAGGLVKLGKTGTAGFIARSLASDGSSHYPASSEDQFFPWLYGLWHFLQSGLASPSEKAELGALVIKHVPTVEGHQWRIPCDPPAFYEPVLHCRGSQLPDGSVSH